MAATLDELKAAVAALVEAAQAEGAQQATYGHAQTTADEAVNQAAVEHQRWQDAQVELQAKLDEVVRIGGELKGN